MQQKEYGIMDRAGKPDAFSTHKKKQEVYVSAPAVLACCADTAALCTTCDAKVHMHSANPLAQRHQRVPVLPLPATAIPAAAVTTHGSKEEEEVDSWLLLPRYSGYNNCTTTAATNNNSNKNNYFGEVDQYFDITGYNSYYDSNIIRNTEEQYIMQEQQQIQRRYGAKEWSECVVPLQHVMVYEQQQSAYGIGRVEQSASITNNISFSSMEAGYIVPENTIADISNLTILTTGGVDLLSGCSFQMPLHLSPMDRAARVLRYKEKRQARKFEKTIRFLDRAAIVSSADVKCASTDPWKLCTVTQVEELKILIRMFPIWATTIIFFVVYAQNSSLFVEQAMVLVRVGSLNIPPASLSTFDVISVIIWVPLYDRILVPIARKFTGREKGFSEIQRMGIGLVLSIFAMVSAALVESKCLEIARSEGLIHVKADVSMSIFWQIPQYFLVGAAEVFTVIGQLEFFYDQGPDAMRSLCSAFALVTGSLGSYVSSIILTLVSYITTQGGDPGWIPDNLNEGHLNRFFWLIAGISFVNMIVYIGCASRYRYKKAQ